MNTFADYTYKVSDEHTIEIVRYEGSDDRPVIPEMIDGMPVTKIGKHAFVFSDIEEIDIPDGIRLIDTEAFAMCESLQRVSLPKTLEELGKSVFKGSEMLEEIALSDSNDRYEIRDGILYDIDRPALVFCPPGLKMEAVGVRRGTEVISAGEFFANRQLEYVRLPLSLKKIESEAFLFTGALHMIELPPYLKEIEDDAFLLVKGPVAEKTFEIYAFPNTAGHQYALDNGIRVHPLAALLID